MTKFRHNRTMFFVLVAALLSMHWSSAHIHLAKHHVHDGGHHQHKVETHAHKSISSTHQIDNHNVNIVEIDQQYYTKSGHHLNDQFIASTPDISLLSFHIIKSSNEPTKLTISKQRYIDYSTIYGRAPPKAS